MKTISYSVNVLRHILMALAMMIVVNTAVASEFPNYGVNFVQDGVNTFYKVEKKTAAQTYNPGKGSTVLCHFWQPEAACWSKETVPVWYDQDKPFKGQIFRTGWNSELQVTFYSYYDRAQSQVAEELLSKVAQKSISKRYRASVSAMEKLEVWVRSHRYPYLAPNLAQLQ